jgi:hypothetical protein
MIDVRGIDPLIPKRDGGHTQTFPGVAQIL